MIHLPCLYMLSELHPLHGNLGDINNKYEQDSFSPALSFLGCKQSLNGHPL